MGQIGDNEGTFPDGYEHVQERLNETTERLQQIDDQIKNIPKEQGHTLRYNPPHFIGRVVPGSRARTIAALKERQDQIKEDTLAKTEADTRQGDNKAGRVVRDNVREALFPNPYRTLMKEERLDEKGVRKEIEQSQDFMDAELVAKAAERKEALKQTIQPEKQDKQALKQQDKTAMSMSARFSLSLGYTKATEKTDRSPAPSHDRQPEKDRD
ncbi:hypothetical protein [Spirosoma endophyticum]|uniref:Uncharacterized protein n=1 Tax=Spirosoma endophyticum TaxID=662367 RepID=A0A1I2FUZ4_9BACT|nr:hypothetical protein [Spirosoma endophyticum]SFF09165.1 hypothetical protein SAMN05216167_12811 [Spirosoma endophyticum]